MVATLLPVKEFSKPHISCEKKSSAVFRVLLVLCQIFCAAPARHHSTHFLVILHHSWCMVYLLTVFVATYYQEDILKNNMSTIQRALYLSEYVGSNGMVLLAIVTSYCNKDCYRIFPQRIEEIRRRTEIYQSKAINHKIEKKVSLLTFVGVVFCAATLSMDFFYNSGNILWFLRSSMVYIFPNITMSLVIGQYWVLINLITFRYKVLNLILEDLNARQTIRSPFLTEVLNGQSRPHWDAAFVLNDLRSIFSQLDTLVEDVNTVFGLTITMNFLASFLALSIQIFVLYKISDRWTEALWALLLYAVLWIVLHSIKFVFILKGNSCLLDEVVTANTGSILNDLEVTDAQTEDSVNRFLLQLIAKKSIHMACGIIELDMTFLGGILSALSIYVIFLIQVDLGEITLTARAGINATTPQA